MPHPDRYDDLALAIDQRTETELYLIEQYLDGCVEGFAGNTTRPELAHALAQTLGALRDAVAGRRAHLDGLKAGNAVNDLLDEDDD